MTTLTMITTKPLLTRGRPIIQNLRLTGRSSPRLTGF
jgi:hypothetical protein